MQIVKNAAAGTMESSDVYVEIEPAQELTVQLESVVKIQFGDAILNVVQEVLKEKENMLMRNLNIYHRVLGR